MSHFRRYAGIALAFIGFTDNIFSWLTPLTPIGAAFDGILIFAGAYLIFTHNSHVR